MNEDSHPNLENFCFQTFFQKKSLVEFSLETFDE